MPRKARRVVDLAKGRQANELIALEESLAAQLRKHFADADQQASRIVMGLWIAEFGDLDVQPPQHLVSAWSTRAAVAARPIIDRLIQTKADYTRRAVMQGSKLGITHMSDSLARRLNVDPGLVLEDPTINEALRRNTEVSRDGIRRSIGILQEPDFQEVRRAINSEMVRLANDSDRAMRWAVNRGHNTATMNALIAANRDSPEPLMKMWVSERSACVHCLAYNGEVVPVGGQFPHDLTFADRSLPVFNNDLPTPPRHPNCRCRLTAWSESWRTGEVSEPEALKREAERSILKGWAEESESNTVRREAAENLLRQGTQMPQSVQREAWRRIDDESFVRAVRG